jgi:hypothetical protein
MFEIISGRARRPLSGARGLSVRPTRLGRGHESASTEVGDDPLFVSGQRWGVPFEHAAQPGVLLGEAPAGEAGRLGAVQLGGVVDPGSHGQRPEARRRAARPMRRRHDA